MVPRVALCAAELLMLCAAARNFAAGAYVDVDTAAFLALAAVSAAVPHAIGAKHRAAGWERHGYHPFHKRQSSSSDGARPAAAAPSGSPRSTPQKAD